MKGKKRAISGLLIGIVMSLAVSATLMGCSNGTDSLAPTSQPPENTLKIGVLLPLTGTNGKLGQSLRQSIELALELDSGPIAGKLVKLIVEDEGDRDSAVALDKAKKL